MKLNRIHILLIGVAVVILYLFLNRLDFIWGSNITSGQVIRFEKWNAKLHTDGNLLYTSDGLPFKAPLIEFIHEGQEYTFMGESDVEVKLNEQVQVIYKLSDPKDAEIYSFTGFWLTPIIYSLLPLMIVIAAVFSFLKPNDTIGINFFEDKKIRINRASKQN